ncbi:VQ motif-containing protein 17-like [Neltuma alba]|uniref:VQ motif-containing protein 17-like n=1 Tax=Neltuma alba TaxID=207710 RepID=UPI0010A33733|nr:VQ motif-containing protein 17-like [Prosopis alba]
MTKPGALFPSSSSKFGIDQRGGSRQSQVIAKLKPKIRVIHVDAPKIIQTDAANFRDLVQRLTGKPGYNRRTVEKQEEGEDFLGLRNGKRIKNEEEEEEDDDNEISRRSKSNKEIRLGGFFDHRRHHAGFSEVDGFMEQLSAMN